MNTPANLAIERLTLPVNDSDLRALAQLLVATVDSGAAVSFLSPLSLERAEEWWRSTLVSAHPKAIFLVARDNSKIVGTVQLHAAWAPNQPHRAEVVKLLVDKQHRGRGLGAQLMQSLEQAARDAGFTLLTLDAKRGESAERIYKRIGWTQVGTIPRYALDPDRINWHDTVIFYKDLSQSPASTQ